MDELSSLVVEAQNGDKDAFGRIITRFQNMAYASNYAVLGDSHLAQDASQEAFIDAYLSLPKLLEPAAFPGWFRRILIKHCDRQIRGKRIPVVPLEVAMGVPSAGPDPATSFENGEVKGVIRDAIAALPQSQRTVTTLFYVEGYSQKEISEFLELPVTSIKKHLFIARKKLKERIVIMLQGHLKENRPSKDDSFANKVKFFIALQTGDMAEVEKLVQLDSELVYAQTEMSMGLHLEGYWPIGFTALHWAASAGDEKLLTFLLSRGAKMDSTSSGMTPLHTSVLMGRPNIVRLLLDHKADVEVETSSGLTPLHIAALRNRHDIAELLLSQGARIDATDSRGQTSMDWAMKKDYSELVELLIAHSAKKPTDYPAKASGQPKISQSGPPQSRMRLVPVGESLLGRVIDGKGKPLDGLSSLDDVEGQPIYRSATTPSTPILETGIKIIDLFAPFKRGGHIGMFATPGNGLDVALGEVIYKLANQKGGYTICIGMENRSPLNNNQMLGLRQSGIEEKTVCVLGNPDDSAQKVLQTTETGLTLAENFRARGQDVLLLVDSKFALSDGVLTYLKTFAASTPEGAITTIYYGDYTVGAQPEVFADLDGVLTLDSARFKQGLWPAIDPLRSRSNLQKPEPIGETHIQVATDALKLLRRYYDLHLLVEDQGLDVLPNDQDREVAIRARRLNRFLTQPFSVAETWTGLPGQYVSIENTVKACQEILDGKYDSLPEEAFYLVGDIDQAIQKAKDS